MDEQTLKQYRAAWAEYTGEANIPEGGFTAADIAAQEGITPKLAARRLEAMFAKGLLKRQLIKVGRSRANYYWFED